MLHIPAGKLLFHPLPLYVWEWLEAHMGVDERVAKSVVFIGAENERGFSPYGSAVIGLVIFGDFANTVIITAQHILDDIPGDSISVRVNRKTGPAETHKLLKSSAITFKDRAIDLAVFPLPLDPTIYDFAPIPLDRSSWEKHIESMGGKPRPGAQVCVAGLYTTHYGHLKNMPVVRMGHVAALPEEQVMTDRGFVYGLLIECHSIAGLSGSPVFWMNRRLIFEKGDLIQRTDYLALGILIGHHVIETREDEIVVPQFQQAPKDRELVPPSSERREERRTGFAVVLPITLVFEIFESEKMKNILKQSEDELKRRSGYRPASAIPPIDVEIDSSAKGANPQHREDFTALVGEAARKRPQGG